jgi:predicted Zn-dependent peptidase
MRKYTITKINKTKVVLYPIKNVRSIQINLTIKCGSWYENKDNRGYFHFLEHMLFHGNRTFHSTEEMMAFTKDNGIYTNASTSGKEINFFLEVPDVNLTNGLKVFEETIFYPLFPEDKIKNELGVITQEIKSKWDRPETRFFDQEDKLIFGENHPYTQDPLGNIETLQHISSSILKDLHNQYFQPQNMIMTIVGNVGNTDILIKKLTKIFNKHPNNFLSKFVPPTIKPSTSKIFIYHDKPEQETISLIWILRDKQKPNRKQKVYQKLYSNIIGNSVDSFLFKIFRLKYGLVYSINSQISNYDNCSLLEIYCQIDPKNSPKFFEVFDQEMATIFSKIDQYVFKQMIKYQNYQALMVYDSVKEISQWITSEAINYQKIFLPEDYISLTKKINFTKTYSFLKNKLSPQKKYIFRMTPIKPEN